MSRKDIQEELTHLLNLLRQEREADLKHYQQKMKNTSLNERRKQGVSWYPVQLEKSGFSSAEHPIIRVSRNREHRESHLFQSGKLVQVFTTYHLQDDESYTVNGVVNQVRDYDMLITLNANDTPDWAYQGKIGVQLLFDDNSYREMENALKTLLNDCEQHTERLKTVLLGKEEAEFHPAKALSLPELNDSQNTAIQKVLQARDVAIIHGPPGTGKTTTVVQAIKATLQTETQILVCAPSNAAVDLIAEKLLQEGISVIRIGHPAKVTEEMLSTTLDAKITQHEQYKTLKELRRNAEEYKNMANKYKRHFGPAERKQRHMLRMEARRLRGEADALAGYIKEDILTKAFVIASTLVGANNFALKHLRFDTVFIDEAAQGLEPACWIPILKARRVIFAGDHFQLPPTIKSFEAAKAGLATTLFEKAIQRNQADVLLSVQYRMNAQIMAFSNQQFYQNQLQAHDSVAAHTILPEDAPIEFIDTAGCSFDEEQHPENKSTFNREEMTLLFKHLRHYTSTIEQLTPDETPPSIGIISPYKAQVSLLQEAFQEQEPLRAKVHINTIDSFQGQERDIIYLSLVRSNSSGEIGFLADTRRMNVAMTRARKKLVIIGDSATIGQHPFYNDLLDYVNSIDAYHSAYEWL